jgi:formylglycine-generating enzyme required for sulfatase activity
MPYSWLPALLILMNSVLAEAQPSAERLALSPSDTTDATLPAAPCLGRPGRGPEMVIIPAGDFRMGSPESDSEADADERPDREVSIRRAFALARCETRVGEFRRFIDETGYRTDAERRGSCLNFNAAGDAFEEIVGAYWDAPGFAQTEDHPVVCVSFDDALAYADWLSARTGAEYRLPTEAEWEYAARAGTLRPRYWSGGVDAGCAHANGRDQAFRQRFAGGIIMDCNDGALFTAPAGNYRRNPFGLSDMIGNVWEWVADCWHDNYQDAPADEGAWLEADGGECARRVVRGGGWGDNPRNLRSANRDRGSRDGRNAVLGFRLARTL